MAGGNTYIVRRRPNCNLQGREGREKLSVCKLILFMSPLSLEKETV
jgi:hypothetical protein